MEYYQMNQPLNRPYRATCGMMSARQQGRSSDVAAKPQISGQSARRQSRAAASRSGCGQTVTDNDAAPSCACHMPGCTTQDAEMYTHIDQMEPAMAYVPCQKFTKTYDLCYALHVGTIFPQLCRPFCGKRGAAR